MITSATRPLMPNLVIVRLAGARPRIGEIVTPGVYFFYLFSFFLLFDLLVHLHSSFCKGTSGVLHTVG